MQGGTIGKKRPAQIHRFNWLKTTIRRDECIRVSPNKHEIIEIGDGRIGTALAFIPGNG